MNLIDHTKTFIVAPCRYVPIPHGLRFGRHSDCIYTIRRAEGSRSNSSPRLGRFDGGQILDPAVPNLVGTHISHLVGGSTGEHWVGQSRDECPLRDKLDKSPGSERPGQQSGWYRSTALDDSCRSRALVRGGSLCDVGV